jgi:hypothetical protein
MQIITPLSKDKIFSIPDCKDSMNSNLRICICHKNVAPMGLDYVIKLDFSYQNITPDGVI